MTRWVVRAIQGVEPRKRVEWAVRIGLASSAAWPITSFTVFASEPQGLLALSWLAIIGTCIDIVMTTDVRDSVE